MKFDMTTAFQFAVIGTADGAGALYGDPVPQAAAQACRYRYALWRTWDASKPAIAFIGLNPSTATEHVLDPTIRRCLGFAKQWGYGTLYMLNLFGYRATDPLAMKAHPAPVGKDNGTFVWQVLEHVDMAVACWGAHGNWDYQADMFRSWYRNGLFAKPYAQRPLYHLGLTRSGEPKHPLYLRADTQPRRYDY